ncbi:hypothetical protein OFAG_02294 [Oxalobacter formigenes HOxBLS]|uniref:Uncharacterized protein n=1 Tax=Oxalobacter paraformigenes TaxID=556268 RepID=T5LUM8_9BURK|nr:hypothetical protein OFAG_02294 [Oxalobacter paraformigenes]
MQKKHIGNPDCGLSRQRSSACLFLARHTRLIAFACHVFGKNHGFRFRFQSLSRQSRNPPDSRVHTLTDMLPEKKARIARQGRHCARTVCLAPQANSPDRPSFARTPGNRGYGAITGAKRFSAASPHNTASCPSCSLAEPSREFRRKNRKASIPMPPEERPVLNTVACKARYAGL